MIDTIIEMLGGYSAASVADIILAIGIIPVLKMVYHIVSVFCGHESDKVRHTDSIYGSLAWLVSIVVLGCGAYVQDESTIMTGIAMLGCLMAITVWYVGLMLHDTVAETIDTVKSLADDTPAVKAEESENEAPTIEVEATTNTDAEVEAEAEVKVEAEDKEEELEKAFKKAKK